MWPARTIPGPYSDKPLPPKLDVINRDERLAKLGEDPEFKDIVATK